MEEQQNEIQNEQKQFKISEVTTLIIITLVIGFILGLSIFKVFNENKEEKIKDKELTKFIENYNYIVENYYGDLDKNKLIDSAISGMLDAIEDPYTTYINESTSNTFSTALEGSFEGIGVEIINDSDNNVVVYSVIDNSPAQKAGIKPLDVLISVNGKSIEGMDTSDFVTLIKKSEDSELEIELKRENEIIKVKLKREIVTIKSTKSELFEKNNKKIGYIYISIFANNTYNQFKQELEKLEKEGIDGLIIDVRGNTGGHLTTVENILSLFLDKTHIIYQTEDKNGTVKAYSKGNETKQYNIVVLTNESSASASEILAAALSEEYNATLVGKKTYGKGTVQELKTLPDGEQYKFTTKKWLTPKGNWINEKGIEVDVEVEFNKDYYENPTYDNDKQLQTAINTITK
jgi:carboxyl-terminal processing protease